MVGGVVEGAQHAGDVPQRRSLEPALAETRTDSPTTRLIANLPASISGSTASITTRAGASARTTGSFST
jgi:hypothetical protein